MDSLDKSLLIHCVDISILQCTGPSNGLRLVDISLANYFPFIKYDTQCISAMDMSQQTGGILLHAVKITAPHGLFQKKYSAIFKLRIRLCRPTIRRKTRGRRISIRGQIVAKKFCADVKIVTLTLNHFSFSFSSTILETEEKKKKKKKKPSCR